MRKFILALYIIGIVSKGLTYGQSFDWNLRGGLNLMKSLEEGKDVSLLYHAGLQAGVRIASFGIYGEALYSVLENQYGGDPVSYIAPSLIIKTYLKKFVFVEIGGTYLLKNSDSGVENDILNPDGDILMAGGLGFKISKLEISFRASFKESYTVLQATAAIKF
jgi:hypothetical protein